MSIIRTHTIACDCGAAVTVECCESVNAERHPELRDAVLDRTFHVFACGACGAGLSVQKQVSYVDLPRRQFYGVVPETSRGQERSFAEELVTAWELAFGALAPAAIGPLMQTDRFQLRLCFGIEELREKLVAHDAGLDDLALEVYKLELLASNPDWGRAAVRTLRLDHVEPDGDLAFLLERATAPPTVLEVAIVAARARYDEIAATPWPQLLARFPGLASGPYVSVLRLAA
jgi:hypothetical protein